VTDREQPRLDLLFGVVLAVLTGGQTGERQRERHQLQELFVTPLLIGHLGHHSTPVGETGRRLEDNAHLTPHSIRSQPALQRDRIGIVGEPARRRKRRWATPVPPRARPAGGALAFHVKRRPANAATVRTHAPKAGRCAAAVDEFAGTPDALRYQRLIQESPMSVVGVPREVKSGEYRVAMLPVGAEELTKAGHRVLIEKGAGVGSGIFDEQYAEAGAELTAEPAPVWGAAYPLA